MSRKDRKMTPAWARHPFRLFGFLTACLLLAVMPAGQLRAQEPAAGTEPVAETHESSAWSDELTGPPLSTEQGEIVTASVASEPPPPPVEVFTDDRQLVPIIRLHGKYFDPSGLCACGPLSEETNQAVRSRMLRAFSMGFRCFVLRADWPALQPEPNRIDTLRVQELLSYADDLGLRVILSLELGRAPAWFFRGEGSDRLMESRLVDPRQETESGNDGPLMWSNGVGVPLMYHPDVVREANKLVLGLGKSLGEEPALLGWLLAGPVTHAYPGGGRSGVLGICDYSPFTVNRYYQETGAQVMTYPLARYSQGKWDQRADFRTFCTLRLIWKREALAELLDSMKEADRDHLVLIGMEPVLSYRNDNGYRSLVQSTDSAWQLGQRGVDGGVIGFRLASDSFSPLTTRSECSAMHLALTINRIVRRGRVALVVVEADTVSPPSENDIQHLAYMIKAAGAYPIWCSGFLQPRGHRWSWREENAIERTQPLSLLPPPKRLRRGEVGILDMPQFYSAFYAEQSGSLVLSLTQLVIHQKTGVVLEVVGVDEVVGGQPVLQRYRNLIHLVPELLTNEQAKQWIEPHIQVALAGYRLGGGVIEAVDPMLLQQYALEGYHSQVLEDQLRTRYVHRGAPADLFHGAEALVVANDPYVYIRVNRLRGAHYLDVKLAGWPESNMDRAGFIELPSGESSRVEVISGSASFPFTAATNTAHLFVLTDDYAPVSRPYENRLVAVAMAQQSRHMKRSVPAALLLAGLLVVTLLWMSFQRQQRSLLQAAQLVERRRRIEPIDILDDAEVMAFYKTYLSGADGSGGDSSDPSGGSSEK